MMMDWNQYHKEVSAGWGLMKVVAGHRSRLPNPERSNAKTSKLGEKTRQLISLAVAVTTRCDGCIVVHSEAALKAGATKEENFRSSWSCRRHERGALRFRLFLAPVLDAVEAKSAAAHSG